MGTQSELYEYVVFQANMYETVKLFWYNDLQY